MTYAIFFTSDALRDWRRLDTSVRKIIKKSATERLATFPELYGKPLRRTLKGLWSLRVGNYRIIYQIKGDRVILWALGHRRDVYEDLG